MTAFFAAAHFSDPDRIRVRRVLRNNVATLDQHASNAPKEVGNQSVTFAWQNLAAEWASLRAAYGNAYVNS